MHYLVRLEYLGYIHSLTGREFVLSQGLETLLDGRMANFSTRSLAAFERPERRLAGHLDAAIGAIRSMRGIGGLRDKKVVLVTADTWLACVNQRCVSAVLSARRSFFCGVGSAFGFSQLTEMP